MNARILVIEDDLAMCEVLRYNLDYAGHEVAIANDGTTGLARIDDWGPDLLLLDWMLPGMSGLEVCRTIRNDKRYHELPIILLTARGAENDRIQGLDAGADDYITKPFLPNEMLARVRAVMRRIAPSGGGGELSYKDVVMNMATRKVTRNGTIVKLSPTEFRLLRVFLENPGLVFSREQLLDRAWGTNIHVEPRTVDVHIRRLRQALNAGGRRDIIRTVRSTGYSLDEDAV